MNAKAIAPFPEGTPENRLDPYYVLARKTGFVDYLQPGEEHEDDRQFAVSVELKATTSRPDVVGLSVRSAHDGSRFFTGTASAADFEALSADPGIRVQYAQALAAPRAAKPRWTAGPSMPFAKPARSRANRSKTLLGIVDNGCPFAHQALRRRGSTASTRILSLWIQDSMPPRGALGREPVSFGYGLEFVRSELDHMISMAVDATGSVDEDLCYRLAGYDQLIHRRTHGAHSLGLLAGPRRWRVEPGALASEIVSRPRALPSTFADIAFVQLPQTLMDCNSVAAVEHHAIDGFRHILNVARTRNYENVVISFGYESWVGPHDGTSWFESALGGLLEEARKKCRVEFFLAAGNSRLRRSHAGVAAKRGSAVLHWHVPPGNEVPTFLEIWAPASEDALTIRVTPPDGKPLREIEWGTTFVAPGAEDAAVAIAMHPSAVLADEAHVILIRVAPTHSWNGRATAPHGLWKLSIKGIKGSNIHAHIGRVEGDANSPRRTTQPSFVGRSSKQSVVDESWTLNGHACDRRSRSCGVFYSEKFPYQDVPIEGKVLRPAHRHAADYSGAGPTGRRERPDVSLPMEDGLYHEGAISIGTRSAGVCRMKGTSTAAPSAARLFADKKITFPGQRGGTGSPTTPSRSAAPYELALGSQVLNL